MTSHCLDCPKEVKTLRRDGTPWPRCYDCSQAHKSSLPRCIDCVKPMNPSKSGVVYERCYDCSVVQRGAFQKCLLCEKPMNPSKNGKIYLRCYTCNSAKTAAPTIDDFLESAEKAFEAAQ